MAGALAVTVEAVLTADVATGDGCCCCCGGLGCGFFWMVITGAGADPAVLSATSLANVPPTAVGLVVVKLVLMEFFNDCIMLTYATDDGVVEVLATEELLADDGDIRFGSLAPTTTEATEGGAVDDDDTDDDDGVLLEAAITRESGPVTVDGVPANRFFAAAGRDARAFPVAAASTAEAVTGFPPARFEATNMFLPPDLAAALLATEALLGINIEAARLPEATTDESVGVAVVPVKELICCTGAAD